MLWIQSYIEARYGISGGKPCGAAILNLGAPGEARESPDPRSIGAGRLFRRVAENPDCFALSGQLDGTHKPRMGGDEPAAGDNTLRVCAPYD